MVTKKKKAGKAKTRTVYKTVAKKTTRHTKSGVAMIPSAMATAGLVLANLPTIEGRLKNIANGNTTVNSFVNDIAYDVKQAVQVDRLKKDAIYGIGGYVAGEAVKKFAPRFIKTPLGKVAKKVPKVI